MQHAIEITPESIEALRPQFLGQRCRVISLLGTGPDQAYLLKVGDQHYRITRVHMREFVNHTPLPSNLTIPIVDYLIHHGLLNSRKKDSGDDENHYWP